MMLFRKPANQQLKSLGHIALIGDSPLAFLLAYLLQNNNFNVSFLKPSSKLLDHPVSLSLKTKSFQQKRFSINYTDTLSSPVNFCCIASSPERYKEDFLLAQNSFLKNIPILNFSHIYNHLLFEEQKNKNIIPAYSSCWINLEKNTLEILGEKPNFEIYCPQKAFNTYKNLLKNPFIEIKNNTNTKPWRWKHLAPFVLGNLFITIYKKDLFSLLKQKESCQQFSPAIKEFCSLAKKEKESLKESDILNFLCNIPNTYKSEFSTPLRLAVLEALLPELSYFNTPELYKLFSLAKKS